MWKGIKAEVMMNRSIVGGTAAGRPEGSILGRKDGMVGKAAC